MKRILMGGGLAVLVSAVVLGGVALGLSSSSAEEDDVTGPRAEQPDDSSLPVVTDPHEGEASDLPGEVSPGAGWDHGSGAGSSGNTGGVTKPEDPRDRPVPPAGAPDEPVSSPPGGNASSPTQPSEPGQTPALADDRKPEPAPIDGVQITSLRSFPPQYVAHIQAGLPGGCAEPYTYSVVRDGNVIKIEVLNSMPKADGIACTMIYGMYTVDAYLGSDFQEGVTYTVIVNGVSETFTPGAGSTPPPGEDRRTEPAPIDGVDVLVAESFPPQYIVSIQAGLPSGCAEKHSDEMNRSGNVIRISVLNSMPTGDVACTMIYGMYDLNVNLGSDFQSGVTYTVHVNDKVTTFTAQ